MSKVTFVEKYFSNSILLSNMKYVLERIDSYNLARDHAAKGNLDESLNMMISLFSKGYCTETQTHFKSLQVFNYNETYHY